MLRQLSPACGERGNAHRAVREDLPEALPVRQRWLSNDGGWCWVGLYATLGGLLYAPDFRVIRPPAHGELLMGEVDKRTRVAYKPAPGFTGEDTFQIVDKTTASERVFTLTIVP
jgi:hypothetical protein